MSADIYRFKVGNFECLALSDGTFTYAPPAFPPPSSLLFKNAPIEQLAQKFRDHNIPQGQADWVSSYNCLLIKTNEQVVLVDTGAGGLGPNTGKLLQRLQAVGIAPERIDKVILTHGHPDHIGGNINREGALNFPNARFMMWKEEWDFWNSEQAKLRLGEHGRGALIAIAQKNLKPLQKNLDFIDREGEIIQGITAIAAPGHTPGHMALVISSQNQKLLLSSDAFLHPIHIEQPYWQATVDLDPQQVTATRAKLLSLVAADKPLVFAFHFSFPGLGHIVQKGAEWRWQPLQEC